MNRVRLGRRAFSTGALFLLNAGTSGCGYIRANWARHVTLTRELDAYVIPQPIDKVWESVTLVSGPFGSLTWSGLGFTWADSGPWQKRTSSKKSTEKGRSDVTWYECEGLSTRGGSQVHYTQVTETTTLRTGSDPLVETSPTRRFDLELELIRRFDPAAAARIEAAGETAARDAK